MDFARVELSDEDVEFRHELRAFLARIVTDDVIRRDRETGENFDESVHLAFGAAGYLTADYRPATQGGFTAVRRRIWELEIGRARTPWFHWGTTVMVAKSVEAFGTPELIARILPGVLTGELRLCLGYTEPDGGSDVATCKTRAIRDGAGWVINGSKMFTSNAHNAQYVFLITNTDPAAPKHQSLTMFLVPMDAPGVEIQPIHTVDGDRTNITFYSDVRVADENRIGPVNGGWAVLREALNAEHGTFERDAGGLQKLATMTEHILLTAEAVDEVAGTSRPDYRLGRAVARLEAAMSAPDMFGRVAIAQTMRDIAPDLMDLLGPAGALAVDTPGSAEYIFRLAGPTGIYGGTLEVFRNMIAQHALGLPRPNHTAPKGFR